MFGLICRIIESFFLLVLQLFISLYAWLVVCLFFSKIIVFSLSLIFLLLLFFYYFIIGWVLLFNGSSVSNLNPIRGSARFNSTNSQHSNYIQMNIIHIYDLSNDIIENMD